MNSADMAHRGNADTDGTQKSVNVAFSHFDCGSYVNNANLQARQRSCLDHEQALLKA